jgi:hypothetical protein
MPAAHRWWWLLVIPLSLGVSMAWKSVRVLDLKHHWREVLVMGGQIVLAVVGIAVGLFLLIQVVLPRLPAE